MNILQNDEIKTVVDHQSSEHSESELTSYIKSIILQYG